MFDDAVELILVFLTACGLTLSILLVCYFFVSLSCLKKRARLFILLFVLANLIFGVYYFQHSESEQKRQHYAPVSETLVIVSEESPDSNLFSQSRWEYGLFESRLEPSDQCLIEHGTPEDWKLIPVLERQPNCREGSDFADFSSLKNGKLRFSETLPSEECYITQVCAVCGCVFLHLCLVCLDSSQIVGKFPSQSQR